MPPKHRGGGFSIQNIDLLLDIVEVVLPNKVADWQKVATIYNERVSDEYSKKDSQILRRKFNTLKNLQEDKRAKIIHRKITETMEFNLEESIAANITSHMNNNDNANLSDDVVASNNEKHSNSNHSSIIDTFINHVELFPSNSTSDINAYSTTEIIPSNNDSYISSKNPKGDNRTGNEVRLTGAKRTASNENNLNLMSKSLRRERDKLSSTLEEQTRDTSVANLTDIYCNDESTSDELMLLKNRIREQENELTRLRAIERDRERRVQRERELERKREIQMEIYKVEELIREWEREENRRKENEIQNQIEWRKEMARDERNIARERRDIISDHYRALRDIRNNEQFMVKLIVILRAKEGRALTEHELNPILELLHSKKDSLPPTTFLQQSKDKSYENCTATSKNDDSTDIRVRQVEREIERERVAEREREARYVKMCQEDEIREESRHQQFISLILGMIQDTSNGNSINNSTTL